MLMLGLVVGFKPRLSGLAEYRRLQSELEPLLAALLACPPLERLDDGLPRARGIYSFWESGLPLYIGRTNDVRGRIHNHTRPSSGSNSASFAFILAKEMVNLSASTIASMTRSQLERHPTFARAFTRAKVRVANMKIRFVEISDPRTQAVFEVYAATVLNTPHNDFENH